jgi:DNA-binding transcriptional ArsR family regulator
VVSRAALLALTALAFSLALLLAPYRPSLAEPALVQARAGVSVEKVGELEYRLTVTVRPFTALKGETVACAYGAGVAKASPPAEVEGNCIKITVDNPSPKPLTVEIEAVLAPPPTAEELPLAAIAAVVAGAAAAAYLSATESGREKLFKAVSVPAAYYIVKRSDVARSAKRVRILEYVKANPGATMRRISRETGISFGEVQWHLSVLERLGLVERVRVGRFVCYYPKGAPPETWLPAFAERELGLKLNPEDLKRAAPRLEAALAKGALSLEELATLAASTPGS